MALLINSDNYTDEELGMTLYRALSISIDGAEPWYLLSDEDKQYYIAAGRDFIRYLQRSEGKARAQSRQRLWVFDFTENRAKRVAMTTDATNPHLWVAREGREKTTYILGQTAFETKVEALRYGWDRMRDTVEKNFTVLKRLSREIDEEEGGQHDEGDGVVPEDRGASD